MKSGTDTKKNADAGYALVLQAKEDVAILLTAMLEVDAVTLQFPNPDAAPLCRLEIITASRAEATARLAALAAVFRHSAPPPWKASIRKIVKQDWAESWKQNFRTRRVSRRLVIKPTWETYAAKRGERVIELDPGLSFGTGLHETTRACLRFLDKLQPAMPAARVLDIGCGSGILAIAAAKLGFPRVLAIDNDAAAVRIARDNISRNGVAAQAPCRKGDIRRFRVPQAFPLVIANLLAGLLVDCADRIARTVSLEKTSRLILSGILTSQYPAVRKEYEARGFRQTEALTLGAWTTGCFAR